MPQTATLTARLRAAFDAYADAQTFAGEPASLYGPISELMGHRGKAVRPTLLQLAHALGSDDDAAALPAAYALELFHNFTLVHDDIMDEAPLRRGRPAMHVAAGVPTAILAGDAMLIATYGYFLDAYAPELATRLLAEFQATAMRLCEGQQLDMDLERGVDASYGDYLRMIYGKTGVLLTSALVLGGTIAGLADDQLRLLRDAGDLAGRAFQLQDDLLDTFSTSAVTGKADYGDIVRGKRSAPYFVALDRADDGQRARLAEAYAWSVDVRRARVSEVLELYRELGVEKYLRERVEEATGAGLAHLRRLGGDLEARRQLIEFTERLAGRLS